MRVRCDCGHEIVSGDRTVLVNAARRHAAVDHQMDISPDRILALAESYQGSEETPATEPGPAGTATQ